MAPQGATFSIRLLQPQDLDDVKRLHKYATQAGRPVFAQYGDDAAAVLEAAAAGVAGTFGLAVLAADPYEPGEEPELVAAATAQAEQQQQQGGSDLVLLTLVVRADVRQQGVGRMLLQALLEHARQAQASGQQPFTRVVTDIGLNNSPAWQFFTALGFTRGAAQGATAEAWLALQNGAGDAAAPAAPPSTATPPAAAAALPSSYGSSRRNACFSMGHRTRDQVLPRGMHAARHLAWPVLLWPGRQSSAAAAKTRPWAAGVHGRLLW